MRRSKSNIINYWLLFLIWPFGSLIAAFNSCDYRKIKVFLWAFSVFYGLSFTIEEGSSSDILRHFRIFSRWYEIGTFNWQEISDFHELTSRPDYYKSILFYLLSRVGNSLKLLGFGIYFLFGYFYADNFTRVYKRYRENKSKIILPFLLLLSILFLPSLEEATGLRFATATVFFLNIFLRFLENSNWKILLLLLIAPMIHFTYWFFIPLIILFFLTRRFLNVWFVFYLLTLITPNGLIDNNSASNIIASLSVAEEVSSATDNYLTDDVYNRQFGGSASKSWHARYYFYWFQILVKSLIAILAYHRIFRRTSNTAQIDLLLSFTLVSFSFINLVDHLPSAGRFSFIPYFLGIFYIIIKFNLLSIHKWFRELQPIAYFIVSLFIIVSFRTLFYFASISTFFSNPIFLMFLGGDEITINYVLKSIF
ncbi:hypothetical protein [Phaeodactylibacter xiamenensis]|uniref:hypothetical protein n=1 Tax=Phaeodactylibacter xiamenensis TaxID=1524460 RepID=UPI003BAA5559